MKHVFIFIAAVCGCVSISKLLSIVVGPADIEGFVLGIKIWEITAGIKKFKSIVKEKEKSMIIYKLNTSQISISKALSDSCTNHDKFAFANNELKEYNEEKQEIKNSKNDVD